MNIWKFKKGICISVMLLLITSLKNKNWIVPKGIIEPGSDPVESALKEAHEEAGIKGRISSEPIGKYKFKKWGGKCRVSVYLMKVEEVLDEWEEKEIQDREWFDLDTALGAVEANKIAGILKKIPVLLSGEKK